MLNLRKITVQKWNFLGKSLSKATRRPFIKLALDSDLPRKD